MAYVRSDGFDLYNGVGGPPYTTGVGLQSAWILTGNIAHFALIAGRFGGQALRATTLGSASAAWFTRSFAQPYAQFSYGWAFEIDSPGNLELDPYQYTHFCFQKQGYPTWGIRLNPAGGFHVTRQEIRFPFSVPYISDTGSTILGSSADGLIHSGWHYFSVECDMAAGDVRVYLNGDLVVTVTGASLSAMGLTVVDGFSFQRANALGGFVVTIDIDDTAEYDTDADAVEGAGLIIHPNADVAVAFTRSSGASNFDMVNDILADGDLTYNEGASSGDKDKFEFEDVSPATRFIGITLIALPKKTAAGTVRLTLEADSGGSLDTGSPTPLALDYQRVEHGIAKDPATAADWLDTAINAIKASYERD